MMPESSGDIVSSTSRLGPSWWFLVTLLIAGVLFALVLGRVTPTSGGQSPAVGKPAPEVDLMELTGLPTATRLRAIPGDRVTLLHLWGTWCAPCKLEYPQLSRMAVDLESVPNFRFLSVSCEGGPDETVSGLYSKTQSYFADAGINGDVYCDPRGVTRRSLAERLERDALFYPTSVIITAEGRIAGVWEGLTDDGVEQMSGMLGRLLNQ